MTLDGNGLWEFYSFYGSSSAPFSISAYIGIYIKGCACNGVFATEYWNVRRFFADYAEAKP